MASTPGAPASSGLPFEPTPNVACGTASLAFKRLDLDGTLLLEQVGRRSRHRLHRAQFVTVGDGRANVSTATLRMGTGGSPVQIASMMELDINANGAVDYRPAVGEVQLIAFSAAPGRKLDH